MAENNAPQNHPDEELSVEELESVAGGDLGSTLPDFDSGDGIQNDRCPTNGNCVKGCGG